MFFSKNKLAMVSKSEALPDNPTAIPVDALHYVSASKMVPPFVAQYQVCYFAMGCFWGAERLFWSIPGVVTTAVGYQGGYTVNPSYQQVCTGQTGHTEAVLVVFDPEVISYAELLILFWENHQTAQGMRQGNDQGTQYRSALYCTSKLQLSEAKDSAAHYQQALADGGSTETITTEIDLAAPFYYAEADHQQYLAKNPQGYCGIGGSGICYPSN
ncbi:peptide-methionine (S)-S-oxide reductase MsrA [Moritella dasanensis]|uniref:peptide-methionine (S)-S-oxide reductase MsrA n=1 Tax=Moritella dasanensis TaxID=428031 RepID=UPI0002DE4F14|nr:peptide-methionine (S)-S-oxide reductase MsrA [Moritella dasanensis]